VFGIRTVKSLALERSGRRCGRAVATPKVADAARAHQNWPQTIAPHRAFHVMV